MCALLEDLRDWRSIHGCSPDDAAFTDAPGGSGKPEGPCSRPPSVQSARSIRPGLSILHDARPSARLQPSA